MKPDLLSILIRVNDVDRNLDGADVATWEADYRFILDANHEANPELRLVLLDPFVLPSGRLAETQAFSQWREQIDRLIRLVGRLAKDYNAVHFHMRNIFDAAARSASPEQWIWDGVHPLPQGYELIARNWLHAVSARWPKE